jgi:hypothetical protein
LYVCINVSLAKRLKVSTATRLPGRTKSASKWSSASAANAPIWTFPLSAIRRCVCRPLTASIWVEECARHLPRVTCVVRIAMRPRILRIGVVWMLIRIAWIWAILAMPTWVEIQTAWMYPERWFARPAMEAWTPID